MRRAFVDADRLVRLREHLSETILVLLARRPGEPIRLWSPLTGLAMATTRGTLTAGPGCVPTRVSSSCLATARQPSSGA